jgi:enoyl-CoA hydratase/carnithine racemase
MYTTILFEEKDNIAKITFNRPEKLNAMNHQMIDELIDALTKIHRSSSIKALVFTGMGKSFMSGADIGWYSDKMTLNNKEFLDMSRNFQQRARQMYSLIEQNHKPVIAAVNGYALGGGFELLLCCDLVCCVENAKLGLPEILLNLVPGGGGTQRLPRKVGTNLANEMLLTGKFYTPQEMYRWGIVNIVTDDLEIVIKNWCDGLAEKSNEVLAATKKLVRASSESSLDLGLDYEGDLAFSLLQTDETKKKFNEFIEKSQLKKR